jgi:hypothetical protein
MGTKYIKTFEDFNKGDKFIKMVPITKNDKTFYRKYNVGSNKNFTKANFDWLEKCLDTKLNDYKNWLLTIYPTNCHGTDTIFFDENNNEYRLYNIEVAYRQKLLNEIYKGILGKKEYKKLHTEKRAKYLDYGFGQPVREEPYSKRAFKGALKTALHLKKHPFENELFYVLNPPKDLEKANIVAGTEIGKNIVALKDKEKQINEYWRKKQFNSIINEFNIYLHDIDFDFTTMHELSMQFEYYKNHSKVDAGGINIFNAITDETDLKMTLKNGKEVIKKFGVMMLWMKGNPLSKLPNVKSIECINQYPQ